MFTYMSFSAGVHRPGCFSRNALANFHQNTVMGYYGGLMHVMQILQDNPVQCVILLYHNHISLTALSMSPSILKVATSPRLIVTPTHQMSNQSSLSRTVTVDANIVTPLTQPPTSIKQCKKLMQQFAWLVICKKMDVFPDEPARSTVPWRRILVHAGTSIITSLTTPRRHRSMKTVTHITALLPLLEWWLLLSYLTLCVHYRSTRPFSAWTSYTWALSAVIFTIEHRVVYLVCIYMYIVFQCSLQIYILKFKKMSNIVAIVAI